MSEGNIVNFPNENGASETQRPGKASLYRKIAAVTGDMKRIPKSGKHQQGWSYPTWDDISQAVNDALGSHNLAVIPGMAEQPEFRELGKNANGTPNIRCSVVVDFTLACGDTGETETRRWFGHADDTSGGEKAIDKALTYTIKSFLKKTFIISAGRDEDPEGATSSYEQQGYQPNNAQVPAKSKQQKPAEQKKQEPAAKPAEQAAPTGGAMDLPDTTVVPEKQAAPAGNQQVTKDLTTFLKQAEGIGYSRDQLKEILLGFSFPKSPNGGLNYQANNHDAMLEALRQWRELQMTMQPHMSDKLPARFDTIEAWLKYMGALHPYTSQLIKAHIPTYVQYQKYVDDAKAITPDVATILREHQAPPWRPERNEMLLGILKSHVQEQDIKNEIAASGDDIIEDSASIEDVVGGGIDEATAASDALLDELLGNSSAML